MPNTSHVSRCNRARSSYLSRHFRPLQYNLTRSLSLSLSLSRQRWRSWSKDVVGRQVQTQKLRPGHGPPRHRPKPQETGTLIDFSFLCNISRVFFFFGVLYYIYLTVCPNRFSSHTGHGAGLPASALLWSSGLRKENPNHGPHSSDVRP